MDSINNHDPLAGSQAAEDRFPLAPAADAIPSHVSGDLTLPSGTHLNPGGVVIASTDAANYDPRAFTDPHTMDFARFTRTATDTATERHLSFGYGIHHCIGRHLRHTEVVTAIALLLRELPALRLAADAADIPRKIGHAIAGPTHLPVAWS
ncbi:cytochrome P450 [Planomonospora sp. ID82291]|uniref:cytochrome P450 n=1 Tax=Planomonospora sp. ID82291 TaxID=2738136 RepID=UPI0018C36F61|nr:cytochrome P450 [Planomonospora sp. ID82291]MBG0814276.1 cytochrome P450 [Planomonospora sp. ID82291]